ncbi:hypothetical protein KA517_01895 [Candidatus Gracilibacteria bacterium]|nr:hypothetical protein [Candidatus Gracilibacteria bacterium]
MTKRSGDPDNHEQFVTREVREPLKTVDVISSADVDRRRLALIMARKEPDVDPGDIEQTLTALQQPTRAEQVAELMHGADGEELKLLVGEDGSSFIEGQRAMATPRKRAGGVENPKAQVLTPQLRRGLLRKRFELALNQDMEGVAKALLVILSLPFQLLVLVLNIIVSTFASRQVFGERFLRHMDAYHDIFENNAMVVRTGESIHTKTIDETIAAMDASVGFVGKVRTMAANGGFVSLIDEVSIRTADWPLVHNRNTHFGEIAPDTLMSTLRADQRKRLRYSLQRMSAKDFEALCRLVRNEDGVDPTKIVDALGKMLYFSEVKRTKLEKDALATIGTLVNEIATALVKRNTLIINAEEALATNKKIARKRMLPIVSANRAEDVRFVVKDRREGGRQLSAAQLVEKVQLVELNRSTESSEIDQILAKMKAMPEKSTQIRVAIASGDETLLKESLGDKAESHYREETHETKLLRLARSYSEHRKK